MRTGIALLLACTGALAGCGSAPEVPPSAVACGIAADFMKGTSNNNDERALVFTEEPEASLFPLSASDWQALDKPDGGVPSAALVDALNRTKLTSAVKGCPSVRAILDKAGIAHGAAAVDKVTAGSKEYDIEGIAAPVMSSDGASALLVVSSQMKGGLTADRFVHYMRRDAKGGWVIAAIHRF